jgi:hypothetical protein
MLVWTLRWSLRKGERPLDWAGEVLAAFTPR